ncbi:MAG: ubiquinol-cytochrome c reductase iron-sulfur subunit [Acidimicrobiia bacterium]
MEAGTVLLIAIPVLIGLAVLFVISTTISRQRSSTGALGREARRADKSTPTSTSTEIAPAADLDEEARARYAETKKSLQPAGDADVVTAAGGLIRFGEAPADPEALGVSRRSFFNRAIVGASSVTLGAFGAACIGFLWPSLSGGFGGKISAGSTDDILDSIKENKEPFYVPEARSYVVPYPESALDKARGVYEGPILEGMEAGYVALSQKCPHLGCRVPWCATSQWFECPCHGSKYNRVGEKKGGPAPRGMDRWPVEIAGGQVAINTAGLVTQGPPIGTNTTGQEAEGPNCV